MAEHRIRLRGGWECQYREGDSDDAPEVIRRLDLPLDSLDGLPARFRLTRQFGRPPVDPLSESVTLEYRNLAGLKSLRINGIAAQPRCSGVGGVDGSVGLGSPLLPRNGLVLEIDLGDLDPRISSPWGDVALVIRPRAGSS